MPNYLYKSVNGTALDTWTEIEFVDHGTLFQSNYVVLECSVNPLLVEFSYDGTTFKDAIEVNPLMPKFPYFYCARKVRYRNMTAGLPSTFQITAVGG